MNHRRRTSRSHVRNALVETERLRFVCECGDAECKRPVLLTLVEYEAHRPEPLIHSDHRRPSLRLVGS
jgi:hypothetical protein